MPASIALRASSLVLVAMPAVASAQSPAAPVAHAPQGSPADTAAEAKPPRGEVWVHLEAPTGTVLEWDTTSGWEPACEAPCDRYLPTTFWYRVDATGIVASNDFALHASPEGRERLSVHPANVASHALGGLAMVVGVPVAGVGAIVTVFFGMIWAADGFRPHAQGDDFNLPGVVGVGAAILGVGAVPLVGGIILLRTRTTVTEDPAPPEITGALSMPWTPAPSWRSASESQRAPGVMGIPVVGGTF